jgi:hypothetical protein
MNAATFNPIPSGVFKDTQPWHVGCLALHNQQFSAY